MLAQTLPAIDSFDDDQFIACGLASQQVETLGATLKKWAVETESRSRRDRTVGAAMHAPSCVSGRFSLPSPLALPLLHGLPATRWG